APRRRAVEVALGRADPDRRPPESSLIGLGVADILRALATHQPTVVGIDDLQWCDGASDEVLAYAARRLRSEPVGFVLARRTANTAGPADPPATHIPGLALACRLTNRLDVGPLSAGALGRLIHERLGVAHPRPLLLRVHDACSGNSFLALEISRSLLARTVELAPGEPFPVPPEVGPLVRDHLATLTGDARRSVVIVAMSPGPSLDLVERVLGPGGASAVDEACQKGVLVADGTWLRAHHPLIASTAYADAPPGERRALRRALAAAADDPVERAVHLSAMVEGPDADVAEALASAGRLALNRGAPSIAAELLERAAGVADGSDDRAALLIEAADAAVVAGDPARAEAGLRAVLDLEPADRLHARALLALGEITYVERPNDTLPLLVEALEHVADDPILEATVHSYVAAMADMDPAASIGSAERAAEILQRPDVDADPDHLGCALLDRAFHCLLQGEPAPPEDIERGLALWSRRGDSFVARRAQELAERCLFHLGRLGEALALDEEEYRRLTERGQFGLLPPLVQSLSVMTQLTGDWAAARRYADECMDMVEQGEQAWRARAMLARGRVLAWEGELDAARSIAVPAGRGRRPVGGCDLRRAAWLRRAVGARSAHGTGLSEPSSDSRRCHRRRAAHPVPIPGRSRRGRRPGR
ncbi:MAG: hypothetical protein L0Y54_06215, partial [Sporichthyaceae bacterium]|nr:hypothetical protein [Sporichthyaceae bacterium]